MKVTKAVFPVAGLGTRFLPATKAMPKEMLPVVDKPLIQYAVEEALDAGIADQVIHEHTGLVVDPMDEEAIASSMARLLIDAEEARIFGR